MYKDIIENLKENEYIDSPNKLRPINFYKNNVRNNDNLTKGYFHKWVTYASNEGSEEYALIEDYYGNIYEVFTKSIRFLDSIIK